MKAEKDAIDVIGYDIKSPPHMSDNRPKANTMSLREEDPEYEEIPLLDDRHAFLRMKGMIQLEPDIFEWLAAKGRDYETRANAVLRRAMLLDRGF